MVCCSRTASRYALAALPNTRDVASPVRRGEAAYRTSKTKAESCWQFARKSTRLSLKIAIKTLNWSEKRSIEINISPRNRRRIGGSSIKSCIACAESKSEPSAKDEKRERARLVAHTTRTHLLLNTRTHRTFARVFPLLERIRGDAPLSFLSCFFDFSSSKDLFTTIMHTTTTEAFFESFNGVFLFRSILLSFCMCFYQGLDPSKSSL